MEHRTKTKVLVVFEVVLSYIFAGAIIYLIVDSKTFHDYPFVLLPFLLILIILYLTIYRRYKKWRNIIEEFPIKVFIKRDVDKLALMLDSNNLDYRKFSLYALSDIKDKKSFDLINQKLIKSQSNSKDDIVIRHHIYYALRNLNDKRVITALEKAFEKELENDEMKLAVSAAFNLSKMGDAVKFEKIKKINEETTDNQKKWEIERGIELVSTEDKDPVDLYNKLFDKIKKKYPLKNNGNDQKN